MIRFDVKSLFTKVPVHETLLLLSMKLAEGESLLERMKHQQCKPSAGT